MTPTLSHVLASGGQSPFNLAQIVVAAAVVAAVLTVAKGRALFRRDRVIPNEKEERLSSMLDELNLEKQQLSEQKTELQNQLQAMESSVKNLNHNQVILEKSNLVLAREREKIKLEKEKLEEKISLESSTPLVTVKTKKSPPKADAPLAQKPKRVSRKKK